MKICTTSQWWFRVSPRTTVITRSGESAKGVTSKNPTLDMELVAWPLMGLSLLLSEVILQTPNT